MIKHTLNNFNEFLRQEKIRGTVDLKSHGHYYERPHQFRDCPRLSTIRDACLILVMNHGMIIEKGAHKSLLAVNGFSPIFITRNVEAMRWRKKECVFETPNVLYLFTGGRCCITHDGRTADPEDSA